MFKKVLSISLALIMTGGVIPTMAAQTEESEKVYLRENFASPPKEYRPIPFYHMDGDISNEAAVEKELREARRSGYGGVAILPVSETWPQPPSDAYYTALEKMLNKIESLGMQAIYYDDINFPSGYAFGAIQNQFPDMRDREIRMHEYLGQSGTFSETIELDAQNKEQIIAVSATNGAENIDLTEYVSGGTVNAVLPEGEWDVYIFKLRLATPYVSPLNYEASKKYIELTYEDMTKRFPQHMGYTVKTTFTDDIKFHAANCRSWTEEFNEKFKEKFGIDPAPYYSALAGADIGEDTMWATAAFQSLRAELFGDGYFKALGEFTAENGLISTGHVAEPYLTNPTNTSGDLMYFQQYMGMPGQDAIHGYMHHNNGFKMTSSSAFNFDKELVACEIYGNYPENSGMNIMYKEAMHAYSRGINYLIPHGMWYSDTPRIPPLLSYKSDIYGPGLADYNEFAARSQYMLQGGRHVADIGMLYPIRSAQAQSPIQFDVKNEHYDVGPHIENLDYMNVINSVLNYANKDLTVIHPDTLDERMEVQGNELVLNNENNFENYKVFIMPSSVMVELSNLEKIEEFYNAGGKVIATGILPYKSYEYGKDAEVCAIIERMFGSPTEYSEKVNENGNGGKTYYLPHDGRIIKDGACVSDALLASVLSDALSVYDVYFDEVINADDNGVFNFLHKVNKDGVDIYYFANASDRDIDTYVNIRGKIKPELWDPMTGKMAPAEYEYITVDGQDVTKIKLKLRAVQATFVVDVTNVAANDILFSDSFDNGSIKWEGNFEIANGSMNVSGYTTAIADGLADFIYEANINVADGADILFRELDERDHYRWSFKKDASDLVLTPYAMHNGTESALETASVAISGDTAAIKIICEQSNIKTYVNDVLISDIYDKTQRYGTIGFTKGTVEDVKVSLLSYTIERTLANETFSNDLSNWDNTENASIVSESSLKNLKEFHLTIDVKGSTYSTFINGKLINTFYNNELAKGGIGFRESDNEAGMFDNFTVTHDGEELFFDDFSNGLSKWKNTNNAEIVDGRLSLNNNQTMLIEGSENWTDYTIDVDVKVNDYIKAQKPNNTFNDVIAVTFRATENAATYYMWQISIEGGNFTLRPHTKVNGSFYTQFSTAYSNAGGYMELFDNSDFVLKDSADWQDYTVDAGLILGTSPVGLTVRKTEDGFYKISAFLNEGKVTVSAYKDDDLIETWPTQIKDCSVKLSVEVSGSEFRIFVNGEYLGSFHDESLPCGGVGFSQGEFEKGFVEWINVYTEETGFNDFGGAKDPEPKFELPKEAENRPLPVVKADFNITLNDSEVLGDFLNGGGALKVSVDTGAYEGDKMLALAVKGEGGKLLSVTTDENEVRSTVSVGNTVQIFLWKNDGTLRPLADVLELPVNQKQDVLIASADFDNSSYDTNDWQFGVSSASEMGYEDSNGGKKLRIALAGSGWGGFITKTAVTTSYRLQADISMTYAIDSGSASCANIVLRQKEDSGNRGLAACADQFNAATPDGAKGSIFIIPALGRDIVVPGEDEQIMIRLVDKDNAGVSNDLILDLPDGIDFRNETSVKIVDQGNEITLSAQVGDHYVTIATIDTQKKKVYDKDGIAKDYTVNVNASGVVGFASHVMPLYIDNVEIYSID